MHRISTPHNISNGFHYMSTPHYIHRLCKGAICTAPLHPTLYPTVSTTCLHPTISKGIAKVKFAPRPYTIHNMHRLCKNEFCTTSLHPEISIGFAKAQSALRLYTPLYPQTLQRHNSHRISTTHYIMPQALPKTVCAVSLQLTHNTITGIAQAHLTVHGKTQQVQKCIHTRETGGCFFYSE